VLGTAHFERRVGGESSSGLVEPALTAPDQAGQHQRLRPRAAVGEAALDEERVEALLDLR
jgi:hypothetical protein